jgi:cell division protein FtsI (penicillin-binding protein 3)
MLGYMETTAESGTGMKAAVGDVPMAVKTGTAQMLNAEKNGYSSTDFISSCIGIFPANDPQIILYIAIVKPVGETFGGRIAAPVISKAANAIIDYLGMGRAGATSVTLRDSFPSPEQARRAGNRNAGPHRGPETHADEYSRTAGHHGSYRGRRIRLRAGATAGTPIEQGMTIELRLE